MIYMRLRSVMNSVQHDLHTRDMLLMGLTNSVCIVIRREIDKDTPRN